ncbi:MAG: HNH endonuclease [Hyphomicrobiales bacterium]|nr:HNH endonuclease [Hyphomicrobiales bacterium]
MQIHLGNFFNLYTLSRSFNLGHEPNNLQILCKSCHRAKTTHSDIQRIAKNKRLKARHLGARAPSSRPIPGSRHSPWKRKLDGSVVKR